MARPDFRAAAARRLSEDSELSPAIISLLNPEDAGRSVGVRVIPIDRIEPNLHGAKRLAQSLSTLARLSDP